MDEGKVVTGRAKGVGRGISTRCLVEGARVVVGEREEAPELPTHGARAATFVQADAREPEHLDRLVAEAVSRFGRLDVLVHNAGR